MSSNWGDDDWGSTHDEWSSGRTSSNSDPDDWGAPSASRSPREKLLALAHGRGSVGVIAVAVVLVLGVGVAVGPRASRALFKQQVTPTELCLTAGVVYVSLGVGLFASSAALDRAAEQADLLNSRVSGDAELDERAHQLANAALDVNGGVREAAKQGLSLDPLVWEQQLTLVGEPLSRAQTAAEATYTRCEQLTGVKPRSA